MLGMWVTLMESGPVPGPGMAGAMGVSCGSEP